MGRLADENQRCQLDGWIWHLLQRRQLVLLVNSFAFAVSAPIANNQFVHVAATYDGSHCGSTSMVLWSGRAP